ncbi:MAG: hypothetical protein OQK81_00800 [Candidatus Bathyarchaeota archaeon]|nr:hypothetical protein [Candidatus Bathyarchaeota archaeon]
MDETCLNFDLYKRIFDFASSSRGLRLSKSSAKLFAEKWMNENYDCDFNRFIRVFNYAITPSGKNLNLTAAIKFALLEVCKQKKIEENTSTN